jgi:hypothetical protein
MVPSSLGALCPSHCCKRDLGTGLAPTGYKLMRRVSQKQKGSALDLLNKRNGNFNGKRGIKKNVQRSYICSVMAGHHCCSARAFAVNPSRLPARPSGLRGLTAQRGQARRACRAIKCRTALARASRNGKEEMLIAKKLLDTRAPHISCSLGLGRSISVRMLRVSGSRRREKRVTLPTNGLPSKPDGLTMAGSPT